MSRNLSRWFYEGDEEDHESKEIVNVKEVEQVVCKTPLIVLERRQSIVKENNSEVANISKDMQKRLSQTLKTPSSSNPQRRNSIDPRVLWEKKLAESEVREKQALAQVAELQRKKASLEERVRTLRNEIKRLEKKQGDALENKIAHAVSKIVQDQELDLETREKIAEAVALAVAQTLLSSSAKVAPPKRQPPVAPSKNNETQLSQI